mgnify:CR=1 FL=1
MAWQHDSMPTPFTSGSLRQMGQSSSGILGKCKQFPISKHELPLVSIGPRQVAWVPDVPDPCPNATQLRSNYVLKVTATSIILRLVSPPSGLSKVAFSESTGLRKVAITCRPSGTICREAGEAKVAFRSAESSANEKQSIVQSLAIR